jgi:2,3-dihydroxy-2,3-dihydro-p-cumate dehydrogenase
MLRGGYGRIVNLGADSVRNGLADHAAYNAAKGGVHGLTTGLAREFAKDGHDRQHGGAVRGQQRAAAAASCATSPSSRERFMA